MIAFTRNTAHLDAHKNERLEFVFVEQGEDLRCRHREERLFDGGEVKLTERGQVDAVVGLAKGCSRSRYAVPEEKVSVTSGVLLRNNHGDLLNLDSAQTSELIVKWAVGSARTLAALRSLLPVATTASNPWIAVPTCE